MEGYSVVISTLMRPLKLRTCLEHIDRIPVSPEKVVVCDDGEDHPKQQEVYEEFRERLNLEVIRLPFNTGLSEKRNEGIEATDSKYILLIDDDHYVPSNIHEFVEILEANDSLGGIAPYFEEFGEVMCNAADYRLRNGWAIKGVFDEKQPEETGTDRVMYRYDHIANSAMYDRRVFEDYTWDEFYVIEGEDTDFYLKHRELGTWDFAVTPNYVTRHDPGPGIIEEYADERKDYDKLNASFDYLTEKFDLKGLFQVDSHLPREWSRRERLVRFLAVHIVPYRVLWWLRCRQVWDRIEDLVRS
jgi:glycosyltransferase involved in cell wall biosynthesis